MTKLEEWVLANGYRLEQHWIEGADNPRDDGATRRTRSTSSSTSEEEAT